VNNRNVSTSPGSASAVVPAAFVHSLLKTMDQAGLVHGPVLADAGFPVDALHPSQAAGSATPWQYSRLCTVISHQLRDEALGAMPDAVTPPGTLRMLALGMLGADTLGKAMRRAIAFNGSCRAHRRLPLENRLWVHDDDRHASLSYLGAGVTPPQQQRSLAGLVIWLRFCGWLIGQDIDIVSASCAGPAPQRNEVLRHFLPGPVHFDAPVNAVTFSVRHLQAPVIRDEQELAGFMALAPYFLLYAPETCHDSVSRRIRNIIVEFTGARLPRFAELARRLNLSARTLRRRLEREGTSYQRIKDTVRRDRAIDLLRQPQLSLFDIAEALGFSDPSAFHRSFKKWTGYPPGEFRR
tara:strand:- start:2590 stop:3645 length:1056 start_codon:yes stop_codon:yes gene_type:complete